MAFDLLGHAAHWLEHAGLPCLQDFQLLIVVLGICFHDLLLYCLVALRLGMMVFRKISTSVSMKGTAYT